MLSHQFAVAGILSESLDTVRKGPGVLAGSLSVLHYTESQEKKILGDESWFEQRNKDLQCKTRPKMLVATALKNIPGNLTSTVKFPELNFHSICPRKCNILLGQIKETWCHTSFPQWVIYMKKVYKVYRAFRKVREAHDDRLITGD